MKNKKLIVFIIIGLVASYFLIYVPITKKRLATKIMEKYDGTDGFDASYEVLKTLSIKCLKGILADSKYICK